MTNETTTKTEMTPEERAEINAKCEEYNALYAKSLKSLKRQERLHKGIIITSSIACAISAVTTTAIICNNQVETSDKIVPAAVSTMVGIGNALIVADAVEDLRFVKTKKTILNASKMVMLWISK